MDGAPMEVRAPRSLAPLFALLAATGVGCAPAIAPLVEHHHVREALCAYGAGSAEDDAMIERGLFRDLDPRVQVSTADVPIAAQGTPHLQALKVHVATNALPIDRIRVQARSPARGVAPADRWSLARLTHETLPESRTVGPGAAEEITIGILAVVSLGLIRIEPSRPRTEYPSEGEMERAAPRAYSLSKALKSTCNPSETEGTAMRCTFAFALRDDEEDPVAIDLEVILEAHPSDRGECTLKGQARLDLGSRTKLAESVAQSYAEFRNVTVHR